MNNIKLLRQEKELSQGDVACAVGVTPQAVSKWERGESDPQWEQAPKLADLFGCTIDELYGRDGAGQTSA